MVREVDRNGLLRPNTSPYVLSEARRRSLILAAAFLISIPLCFVIGRWAYLSWALVPLASSLVRRFSHAPVAPNRW
jgi:hypothetical protein